MASSEQRAAPASAKPSTAKISVQGVLNDEFLPPFSLQDFYAFLEKEHSEENIQFYQDVQKYRTRATPIFNVLRQRTQSRATLSRPSADDLKRSKASLRHSNESIASFRQGGARTLDRAHGGSRKKSFAASMASTEDLEDEGSTPQPLMAKGAMPSLPDLKPVLASLREELEDLINLYMTDGSDREINLPQNIRKRVVNEIREKRNYHPDIFKAALENVSTMMRLSSFPNFLKAATNAAHGEGPVSKIQEEAEDEGMMGISSGQGSRATQRV
ncbi:RGS domain-containing protein [Phlyctochytrium arcticum]|nr:RGS domain-containing protein [Phlyctochytrium arcticum]